MNSAQGNNLFYRALPFREFFLITLDSETALLYVMPILKELHRHY